MKPSKALLKQKRLSVTSHSSTRLLRTCRKLDVCLRYASVSISRSSNASVSIPTHISKRIPLEEEEEPWKFGKVPRGFWQTRSNYRKYFDWLGNQLGIKDLDGWYNVTNLDIRKHHGRQILTQNFRDSLHDALTFVYPEHNWISWKFKSAPQKYWHSRNNHKKFFDWLEGQLNIKDKSDWYNIQHTQIKELGGAGLLRSHYASSLYAALQAIYPEYTFLPWKFAWAPHGFWQDAANHKKFFDWLASELNIKNQEEWYRVTLETIQQHGGSGMMKIYRDSVYQALRNVYPQMEWKGWKFANLPRHFLNEPAQLSKFVSELAEKLHITKLDDWYRVSKDQLDLFGASRVAQQFGSLAAMLQEAYPDHKWDMNKFASKNKRASQRWLRTILGKLFPDREIVEDYQNPDILFSESNLPMQLDVYIPSLSLAFEYQGQQHYHDLHYFAPQRQYQERDVEKRAACERAKITLVTVPYWWNRADSSLAATIKKHRPDVPIAGSFRFDNPIPDSPSGYRPSGLLSGIEATPSFSRNLNKTKAPALLLAMDYPSSIDPTDWWMSEKWDGVRGFWDGQHLVSKQGHILPVPEWFTQNLPKDTTFDGELCVGRGKLNELLAILNSETDQWNKVQYKIFDVPSMSNEPYENRMAKLKEISSTFPSHVEMIPYQKCKGQDHLNTFLNEVMNQGGEGVVLRKPASLYTTGRSSSMLKVKKFQDAEVRVVDVDARSTGLICEQVDGTRCLVKCTGQVLQTPPGAGTVISVHHSGYWKSGKLKYPFYWRERTDVKWEDIVGNTNQQSNS